MKRAIIAVAATLASFGVHAESWFEIEAGVGFVHSQEGPDGLWYWHEGTHSLKDNNIGVRAGVQMNLTEPDHFVPGVRLHLDYYNFGRVEWNANAGEDAPSDHSFGLNTSSHQCYNNNCGNWRNFASSGSMQAIALTVEPFWNVGNGWSIGVEVGPALFRSTWHSSAVALTDSPTFGPAGTVQTFDRAPRWQFGQIAGLSVSKGALTVRYDYLRAPIDRAIGGSVSGDLAGTPQFVPSGVTGQHMISLNYRF